MVTCAQVPRQGDGVGPGPPAGAGGGAGGGARTQMILAALATLATRQAWPPTICDSNLNRSIQVFRYFTSSLLSHEFLL